MRRIALFLGALLSVGVLFAAACSDDVLPEVPAITFDAAGLPDGAAIDSNANTSDSSSANDGQGANDTSTQGDGATTTDGGIDAAPNKCDGAVFCDDFDDGTLSQWSKSLTDPATTLDGGPTTTIGVTTDDVRSAPFAVIATIKDPNNFLGHAAELAASIPANATKTKAVLDFDAKIESSGPSPQALSIVELTGSRRVILLASSALSLSVADGGTATSSHALSQLLPVGAWFHARIVITQAIGHVQVFINNVEAVDVATPFVASASQSLYVGVHGTPGSVRYDNVVFDWQQ